MHGRKSLRGIMKADALRPADNVEDARKITQTLLSSSDLEEKRV